MNFVEGSPLWKLWRWVLGKTQSYRNCFRTPAGEAVLIDLAPFCCAMSACKDEREAGRRDVWLRIQQHLHMSPEELTVLFARLGPEARHQLFNPGATFITQGEN